MQRLVALDLETVPDEALVSAVDGEPTRPYPEQVQRLVAERRARTGGRTDFLPLPYHRPVAACLVEAAFVGGLAAMLWNLVAVWSGQRRWPAKTWSIVLALSSVLVLWVALVCKLLVIGTDY